MFDLEEIKFVRIYPNTEEFKNLQCYFQKFIEPLYGCQKKALLKVALGKDRCCEILKSSNTNEDLGIVVYKNKIINDDDLSNILEIKSFFILDNIKISQRNLGRILLFRVVNQALNLNARAIKVTVSSDKPQSLTFFLSHGFEIKKIKHKMYNEKSDEYFLFHSNPSYLKELLLKLIQEPSLKNKKLIKDLCFSSIEKSIISFYEANFVKDYLVKKAKIFTNFSIVEKYSSSLTDNLINFGFSWNNNPIMQNYLFFSQEPIYCKKQNLVVGYLFISTNFKGVRNILFFSPVKQMPKFFWHAFLKKFKLELKVQGINIAHIIDNNLAKEILNFYPDLKIVTNYPYNSWFQDDFNLSPSSIEMINEIKKFKFFNNQFLSFSKKKLYFENINRNRNGCSSKEQYTI